MFHINEGLNVQINKNIYKPDFIKEIRKLYRHYYVKNNLFKTFSIYDKYK